jgi:molybdopterin-containing oxidoreductase family iron-sulfur binding subunit
MGWGGAGAALAGCDMPTTVTLEEGKETVVSYLVPEEYVIPGIGVWYASTCRQCDAGCGVHGRVREGRVLKLEGNPDSPINHGKLCQMGQAGLQNHYNPDRVRAPMARKNGQLTQVTWDEALALLNEKVGAGKAGSRVAWFTGTVSGHQAVLLRAYLESLGSNQHFAHEVVGDAVQRAVNKDMFGEESPIYEVAKAQAILSFGADFVGASASPVHFAGQYSEFRGSVPRGVLIQVEANMSLTGANADMWVPATPGSEVALALGVANLLISEHGVSPASLSGDARAKIAEYTVENVTAQTGLTKETLHRIAKTLKERSPSLVLAGSTLGSQGAGYQAVAAVMMLNVLLGNVGKTIVSTGAFPFPQLKPTVGTTRDLIAFAEAADKGAVDVAFFYGANPVYTAPTHLKLDEKLAKIPFKVVLTQFNDETAKHADLLLPLASALEDWGTHVAAYQPTAKSISLQQPLMEKLYPDTQGFGDILLALLKQRKADEYSAFADYYAYLRNAIGAMPAEYKGGQSDEAFWQQTLAKGMIAVKASAGELTAKVPALTVPTPQKDTNFPYQLVPAARLHMWDGRHANLPWLQEAPDALSKVVWDSWAELHPRTAAALGVKEGDYLAVTSEHGGTIEIPVYVYRGVHPDVIVVPMGQGHEEYGRYAKGRGVNPLKLLNPVTEAKTGEIALYGTKVKASKAAPKARLIRFGGSETQVGRKLVATVTAEVFNRTERKGA